DALGDVLPGEAGRGVLLAVGEDGDGDVAGLLVVGGGGEASPEAVDGVADGVEQGGAAAGDEAVAVERKDLGDGNGVVDGEDLVVEEDEGEADGSGRGLLVAEEFVEAVDGGLAHGAHRAGTVEDEGDLGNHGNVR